MKKKLYVISFLGFITLGITALSPIIQEVIQETNIFPFLVADTTLETNTDIWTPLFFEGNPFLEVTNPLFKKEITNHANNNNDIVIRVKDSKNNIIVSDTIVQIGASKKLDNLKLNEKYTVEVKAVDGRYFIVMS